MKKQITLYIVVLLFSSFFLTGCTDDEAINLSNELVSEAAQYHENREYKNALEKYGEALEEYPPNSEAYFGVVSILVTKGYTSEAYDVAQEAATRIDSEEVAELFVMVGDRYFEDGEYGKAADMYEESLSADRAFYPAQIALAELYINRGEIDLANESLNLVGGRDRDNHEYLILRAYLAFDDWSEGSDIIDRVDIGEIEMEEPKEQVRGLREVYDLEENDLLRSTYLAREYINAGYPYLAIEILNRYDEDMAEYWDGQYFLGKAYLDYGDYEKALEKLNNAASLGDEDAYMYANLGRAYLFTDNIDRSVQSYKSAISSADISNQNYLVEEYIHVLLDNNMLHSALTTLTDLSEEYDYPWLYFLLCEVSYQQENFTQMSGYIDHIKSYEVLNAREERELIRYELLYLMEDMQEEQKILELIDRYKTLDEFNPEVFLFEAKMLEGESAKDSLERAIELDLEGEVAKEARRMLATIE